MKLTKSFTFIFFIINSLELIPSLVKAFKGLEGLYCGLENCYDVLGATRNSNKEEISKLYRSLAKKYHPDKVKGEERQNAAEKFLKISTAYSVLAEDESRKDYNDMLDDPDHHHQWVTHYYKYYRRVYGAKVDARIVLIGLISVISLVQYFAMHLKYNEAVNFFVSTQKYRMKAQDIAKQKGLLPVSEKRLSKESGGRKSKHKCKEEAKILEEQIIKEVIIENLDIRGGLAKPDVKNILWIQLFLLPITFFHYIRWYIRWIYLFDIKGEPYGEEEKIFIIAKYLGINSEKLSINYDVDSLLEQELWIKENFDKWKKKVEYEERIRLAQNPGYKRYRRYMKKGGPGQITFLED